MIPPELEDRCRARGNRYSTLRNGGVMKHVPKGARFACPRAKEGMLHSVNSNPGDIETWQQLLRSTSSVLRKPPRAGPKRNMSNIIKKRIERKKNRERKLRADHLERPAGGNCFERR